MALVAPLTIAQQAQILRDSLLTWATPLGGKVAVVSNLRDLCAILFATSKTYPKKHQLLTILASSQCKWAIWLLTAIKSIFRPQTTYPKPLIHYEKNHRINTSHCWFGGSRRTSIFDWKPCPVSYTHLRAHET